MKMKFLKNFISKYKHGWVLSYFFVYIIWFSYLERTVTKFHPIHSRLDDLIPFQEVFIIPYFLWFIYIAVTVIYFLLTSKQDFYRCCAFLFGGMTICLIIYTFWPNGHYLRVDLNSLGRSNIFITILSKLYSVDTATNVFPSIHVLNSVGAMIAINKSEKLHNIVWLQWSAFILTVLICMSTVFLKQHSILDVFGGLLLSLILYTVVYAPNRLRAASKARQQVSKSPKLIN
ncbi:MAG: putative rane protein [Firmicutes bacterium]|nr:putative rane protein [Bacillota bacterium]